MLIDLILLMLMLYLNTHLNDNLFNKVNLNTD